MLALALMLFIQDPSPNPAPPAPPYDPLALPPIEPAAPLTLTVRDAARQRDIPLRVWLPASTDPAPVILWSHGLGGSCQNSSYLGSHWAMRGFVTVQMQHAGSDENVWRGVPLAERKAALEKAASGANLILRVADVKAVLDALVDWQQAVAHPLHKRLDLEHVGMCGHSFGAVTTQAVSGQQFPGIGDEWTDARIDAALPMSPSSSAGDAKRAFGRVSVPWLLMTGTDDDSPIGNQTPATRRQVFPALPSTIDRYELVLDGAMHSAFGDRRLVGEKGRRDDNHHRVILALSTAFWETHLRGDPGARAWLHGDGPRTVMAAADSFDCRKAEAVR